MIMSALGSAGRAIPNLKPVLDGAYPRKVMLVSESLYLLADGFPSLLLNHAAAATSLPSMERISAVRLEGRTCIVKMKLTKRTN